MFTITAPENPWLGQTKVSTLGEAIRRRAAWKVNQDANAVILDADGHVVSTREQDMYLAGYAK